MLRASVGKVVKQVLGVRRLKAPQVDSQLLRYHPELVVTLPDRRGIRVRHANLVSVLNRNDADKSNAQMTSRRSGQRPEDNLIERVETADCLDPVDSPSGTLGVLV
jgi:hypothetical protein